MSWLLNIIFSKAGSVVSWLVAVSVLTLAMNLYIVNKGLSSKVEKLSYSLQEKETENRALVAVIEQKNVTIMTKDVQTKNCYDALSDYKIKMGGTPVPRKPKKPKKEEKDEEHTTSSNSSNVDRINRLFTEE
jgi:hypothetical protein